MDKRPYLFKLIPPRQTFAQDMSDAERALMKQHIAYWQDLIAKDIVIVFGPVLDPNGTYGMGVVQAENDDAARAIANNDPTIIAKLNTMVIIPMGAARHKGALAS